MLSQFRRKVCNMWHNLDNVVVLPEQLRNPLPPAADIVIIGGGIMGASIAFHLAEAGVKNITLIERNELGSGSSAKPLGGVRATFSDPGNIILGQRSLDAYETFEDKFKTNIGLEKVGYLFLCRTESEVTALEHSIEIQNALGCDNQFVSPERIAELNPFINKEAVIAGSFSPRDGFAQPSRVVEAYIKAAEALGVTVCTDTEVLDIQTSGRHITAIETNRGTIATSVVICAAGAWSTKLANMIGESLPITPVRRQIGFTPQLAQPHPRVPFTLDLGTTLYFHNHRNGLVLGISNENQEPGFGREFSHEWLPAWNEAAAIVAPSLVNPTLEAGWAGLYENTPDHNAMIGKSNDVDGFFYATGFSGHGFLQGPAVGEFVRDLYLDRETFMDRGLFSAERFATEFERTELHII